VFILALAAVSAACSSDDELTLEEFFEQGQAISDDFEVQLDEVYEELPDDGQVTDENLQAERAAYGEFATVYDEFFDELATLNPPPEAEDAFDELLTAGREIAEYLEELAGRVEEVESFDELGQLLDEGEAESDALQEAYSAACQSLQDIADANDIVTDLECADPI
jgi:hypothetical protein